VPKRFSVVKWIGGFVLLTTIGCIVNCTSELWIGYNPLKSAKADQPEPLKKAYVYGHFAETCDPPNKDVGCMLIGLDLVQESNGKKLTILFSVADKYMDQLFALEPGKYHFGNLSCVTTGKEDGKIKLNTANTGLNQTFEISAGQAVYVGNFMGTVKGTYGGGSFATGGAINWRYYVADINDQFEVATTSFTSQYGFFKDLKHTDLLTQ
jgi:hypothetical protein